MWYTKHMNDPLVKMSITGIIGASLFLGIFLYDKRSSETPMTVDVAPTSSQKSEPSPTSTLTAMEGAPISCPPGGAPCTIATPIMMPGIIAPPLPPQAILLGGHATTTVSETAVRNDIFIGDTQAYLNNTPRYRFMPYPGDVEIRSAYFVLPDFYSIPDQGYQSEPYLTSSDGTKHLVLHLRHQNNVSSDIDATITIQSPIPTTDADHPMLLIETTKLSSVFSLVQNGKEAIIEIIYTPKDVLTETESLYAQKKLNESILNARIYW